MQTLALDDSGNFVQAGGAKRKTDYICPLCGDLLRARTGLRRRPHFYHLKTPTCHQKARSSFHLKIQKTIARQLAPEEILLERPFPEIMRIADIVWPKKKYIFEVQCSPISAEEMRSRTADYESLGYHVFWILFDKQFKRKYATDAELFLQNRRYFFISQNLFIYEQRFEFSSHKRVAYSQKHPLLFKDLSPFDPIEWVFQKSKKKRSPRINHLFILMNRYCS